MKNLKFKKLAIGSGFRKRLKWMQLSILRFRFVVPNNIDVFSCSAGCVSLILISNSISLFKLFVPATFYFGHPDSFSTVWPQDTP